MKKLVTYLVVLFSFAVSIAQANSFNSVVAPLAVKSLLTDVQKVGLNKLIAVGDKGHILISQDGDNWQQAEVPTDALLTAVYFVDESRGWVVGHDATILHTQDGGNSWQIQQSLPKLDKPLLDIYFKDANQGVAIGAYGLFFRTNDGGQTWREEFQDELLIEDDRLYLEELKEEDLEAYNDEKSSILPHFNRMFADGITLYMVGEAGFMAKSNDFGKNWSRIEDIYHGSFYDITRTPDSSLIVVGLRGNIFRSENNGADWTHINSPTTASINSIFSDQFNRLILVGNAGALLVSEDDGKTFKLVEQADRKSILAGVLFKRQLLLVSEVGVKKIKSQKL